MNMKKMEIESGPKEKKSKLMGRLEMWKMEWTSGGWRLIMMFGAKSAPYDLVCNIKFVVSSKARSFNELFVVSPANARPRILSALIVMYARCQSLSSTN